MRPYLFKTADYGQTWQAITAGIPTHDFTRVIRADPDRPGLLYAGTETGVYVSFDDGASWESLQGNLPVAPIHDLAVRDRDLIAATHGRSFWILDDLTPLHQLAEQRDPRAPRLFEPRPTIRFKVYQGFGNKPGEDKNYRMAGPVVVTYRQKKRPDNATLETFLDAGKNPPNGVIVSYYLPEEPPGDVTLTFLDGQGTEIRRFSSKTKQETSTAPDGARPVAGAEGLEAAEKPAEKEEKELRVPKEAGTHRFVWDLRYPEAHKVPGDKSTEEILEGPAVPPGRYQVQLTVGDQTYAEWFELRKDPRVAASQEDLEAQCTLLRRIRDKLSETHDAINLIRDLKGQIAGWERRLATQATTEAARDAAKALKATLSGIEDALIQTKADSPLCPPLGLNAKLAALSGFVDSADAAPTRQAYDAFDDLTARIDTQLTRLRDVIATDLASVNRLIRGSEVPPITPAAAQQSVAGA